MSKYGVKYQAKYIKSGKTYTLDIAKKTVFNTVGSVKTFINNDGSTSVVDNGTDFDITGAVAFTFSPSEAIVNGSRYKVTCSISGLSNPTNQITCGVSSATTSGIFRTTTDTQLLNEEKVYSFYVLGNVGSPVSYIRFEVTGTPNFNIRNIRLYSEPAETTTTISNLMPDPVNFKIRGAGKDKNDIVKGSELEFNFYSSAADSSQFDSIFESEERDYQVLYYRDSTLIWKGWLRPENFIREFVATQYEIQLSATDGLTELKNITYDNDGTPYEDRVTFLQSIKRVFDLLDLNLDFKIQMNIIENDLMTSTENAINETSHESHRFTKDSSGRQKSDNCFVTLEKLLSLWGCTIFQAEGYWYIISDVETSSPLFTYTHNILTETRTATNDLTLDISAYKFRNKGTEQKTLPVKNHETTLFNKNTGTGIGTIDGDFSNGTLNWNNNGFASFTVSSNVATLTTTSPTDNLESDAFTLSPTGFDELTVTFKVKLSSVTPNDQLYAPKFEMRLFSDSTTEITANNPGQTELIIGAGYITYINTFPVNLNLATYSIRLYISDGFSSLTTATVLLKEIETNIVNASGGSSNLDRVYRVTNDDIEATKTTESDIYFGDSTRANDFALLKNGSTVTSSWKRHGETETLPIAEIVSLNNIVKGGGYNKYLNLVVMDTGDNIRPYHKPIINSETFRIKSYTKNHYNWETTLELEQVLTSTPNYTVEIISLTSST